MVVRMSEKIHIAGVVRIRKTTKTVVRVRRRGGTSVKENIGMTRICKKTRRLKEKKRRRVKESVKERSIVIDVKTRKVTTKFEVKN